MNHNKLIYRSFGVIFLFFLLFSASTALAEDKSYGLNDTMAQGSVNKALVNNTPQEVVGTVIGAILSFLGVIFFLLIFYGGIRWMLAQGNESEVEKAKQIIVAAVIGLVIVLAAYSITAFIGSRLTGGT